MKIKFERRRRRVEVVAVHFGNNKEYRWSVPDGMDIQIGDIVWVETQYGADLAKVLSVIDSRGIAVYDVLGRITSMNVDESIKCN